MSDDISSGPVYIGPNFEWLKHELTCVVDLDKNIHNYHCSKCDGTWSSPIKSIMEGWTFSTFNITKPCPEQDSTGSDAGADKKDLIAV